MLLMLLTVAVGWAYNESRTSSMQRACFPRSPKNQLQGRAGPEQRDPFPARQPV
ncbi:hypothetical protein LP420_10765 [Massilia sp. B-10]|nr:hypothetical protein LP420_10765 [Massilia sp. B-10]